MPKPKPAVREEQFSIEIDVKKGQWPFLKAIWGTDQDQKPVLIFIADANGREVTFGEGTHIGIVGISKKKAKRLADFIYRTLEDVPDA